MSLVGRTNAYKCDRCGGLTVTIDVDDGVTPMFLACRASGNVDDCQGRAVSSGYPDGPVPEDIASKLAWEWYRPSAEATRGMSREMREHIERGGLALRERAS